MARVTNEDLVRLTGEVERLRSLAKREREFDAALSNLDRRISILEQKLTSTSSIAERMLSLFEKHFEPKPIA